MAEEPRVGGAAGVKSKGTITVALALFVGPCTGLKYSTSISGLTGSKSLAGGIPTVLLPGNPGFSDGMDSTSCVPANRFHHIANGASNSAGIAMEDLLTGMVLPADCADSALSV